MTFLYPQFLWALTTLAIPIAIHLFNLRTYKVLYFSNVRFLENIKQQTKSSSTLKHWLVLLARLLTLAFLIFAFAQPFIPTNQSNNLVKNNAVAIYLDNSFSMDAENKSGNLFESAKTKIRSIAEAYPLSTKFYFITNDFEWTHQRLVPREQMYEFLNAAKISPTTRKLSEIYSRQVDFFSENLKEEDKKKKNELYWISDFQKTTTDIHKITFDSTYQIRLVSLNPQPTNNLYIDSCWFESPGRKLNETENLYVSIVNKSSENYQNIPVKLSINDTLKALSAINIEAGERQIINLSYTNTQTGILRGKIELTDYPIIYDNTFYFSYSLAQKIKILIINNSTPSSYLGALYATDNYFEVTQTNEGNIKINDFSNYNVIIVNEIKSFSSGLSQELANYSSNGGTVVFIPSWDGKKDEYNVFFSMIKSNFITGTDVQKNEINNINYKHEIYANVFKTQDENADLPVIFKHFVFSTLSQTGDEILLTSLNGHKILSQTGYGKGKVYVFSVPLQTEFTNFVKHALFVPTFYNIAAISNIKNKLYFTLGNEESLELNQAKTSEKQQYSIANLNGSFSVIPYQSPDLSGIGLRLYMKNLIQTADNYVLKYGTEEKLGFGVNYNRKESELTYFNNDEIKEIAAKTGLSNISFIQNDTSFITKEIKELSSGKQFWKLCILLALIFIISEILLIRFYKR